MKSLTKKNYTMSTGTINGTIIYHYTPSLGLAASACAVFAVSTALHTYQTIRTKSWYVVPIILGGAFETVGYIGRILSANEAPDYTPGPYIVQAILILVAPASIAASIYMIMGHIIRAMDGNQYSLVRENLLTKLFVIGDIMSFMVQSTGASMLTKKEQKQRDAGNCVIIGGLVVQLLFFGLFMITMVVFWTRLANDRSRTTELKQTGVQWHLHILVLLICSILIMIRSVFRVIEYTQGQNGYFLSHEIYLYIFDATLMFLVMVVLNIIHPSRISVLNNSHGGGKAISWIVGTEIVNANAVGAKIGIEKDEEIAYALVDQSTEVSR